MNGDSQRSRNGQTMFSPSDTHSPFSKSRFDVDSLVSPLGGGGGAGRLETEPRRFAMPVDPLLDELVSAAPVLPAGLESRLHQLVDDLADGSAA